MTGLCVQLCCPLPGIYFSNWFLSRKGFISYTLNNLLAQSCLWCSLRVLISGSVEMMLPLRKVMEVFQLVSHFLSFFFSFAFAKLITCSFVNVLKESTVLLLIFLLCFIDFFSPHDVFIDFPCLFLP